MPTEAFIKVLGEVAEAAGDAGGREPRRRARRAPALLLGQYLSALGILTAEEEEELHLTMVRGAVALGHRESSSSRTRPRPRAGPRRWRPRRSGSAPS